MFEEKDLIDIINGVRNGNKNYQRRLYDQLSPILYPICLRYLSPTEEAEEALMDSFLKIYQKIDELKEAKALITWSKKICINCCLDALKKKKIIFEPIDDNFTLNKNSTNDFFSNLSAKDVLKLIQLLPSGYRTVLNLYAIEGYQHAEIAKILGIEEGTSKSQLARARVCLQKLIDKHLNIENVTQQ